MSSATSDALATLSQSQNLTGTYRAGGKLAGNSQQLRQNAESDLACYSKKLARLALETADRTLARRLSETPLMMFELVRARQRYFNHPDETHWQQINFQLNQWQQLLERLQRAFIELLHSDDIKPLEMADGRSELGQIATDFNQLLNQLQQEHQQKQRQMEQVQQSLTRMIEQVQQLTEGSHQTHPQIDSSTGLIDNLQQLATDVSDSSHTIVQHAQNGEQHLSANQQSVQSVREASRMTQSRGSECLSSLTALGRSVGDVSAIIDVISATSPSKPTCWR